MLPASPLRHGCLPLARSTGSRLMNAFHRPIRFARAAKERALSAWRTAVLRFEPALRWLKLQFDRGLQWLKLRPRVVFWAGGLGIALAFLVFSGATAAGAALLAWAALRQAAMASERHQEQTNADRAAGASRKASRKPWSSWAVTSWRCASGASIPWSVSRRKARMITARSWRTWPPSSGNARAETKPSGLH
jgi:hypothetical protein